MVDLLFVYGTLTRRSPEHKLLGASRFLSRASVRGRLYDLGSYPGLVRENANGHRVVGELYELPVRTAERILRDLDKYEGSEFARQRMFVTLPNGRRRGAWVYVLRSKPSESAKRIESGRYSSRRGAA